MRRSIIIALAGLSLSIAAPAGAEPQAYTIRIPVAASDLADDQALHALLARVDDAADAICLQIARDEFPQSNSRSACKRDVIRRAVEQAAIPELTRHYAAVRSGWRPETATDVAAR